METRKRAAWGGKRENQTGRPRQGNKVKETISASLNPDVVQVLDDAAKGKGISRSQMIEHAVTSYLQEHENLTLTL